jgi:hypothetical protein
MKKSLRARSPMLLSLPSHRGEICYSGDSLYLIFEEAPDIGEKLFDDVISNETPDIQDKLDDEECLR